MEQQVRRLVDKTWDRYQETSQSRRLIIGIAGIPGSGKTSLAAAIVEGVNGRYRAAFPGAAAGREQPIASYIPMDGYHLTRDQLSAMPDPTRAHARRGAAFTFDDKGFFALMRAVREPLLPETRTLFAPSFDHATKDPVENDIAISAQARVLVFEGNYLALNEETWNESAKLFDELWFVEVEEEVARRRLVARHLRAGIAKDEADAGKRADENDLVNGREIVRKRLPVDEIVKSMEDAAWRPDEEKQ